MPSEFSPILTGGSVSDYCICQFASSLTSTVAEMRALICVCASHKPKTFFLITNRHYFSLFHISGEKSHGFVSACCVPACSVALRSGFWSLMWWKTMSRVLYSVFKTWGGGGGFPYGSRVIHQVILVSLFCFKATVLLHAGASAEVFISMDW